MAFKSDYNRQTNAWFGCLDLPLQVSTLLSIFKYKPTEYKLNKEPKLGENHQKLSHFNFHAKCTIDSICIANISKSLNFSRPFSVICNHCDTSSKCVVMSGKPLENFRSLIGHRSVLHPF